MTPLEQYHTPVRKALFGSAFFQKPGVRGFPDPPPGAELLGRRPDPDAEPLLDASGTAGAGALRAARTGRAALVLEPSRAALRCAEATFAGTNVSVRAGLPWEAEPGSAATVCLAPPTDRGTLRVRAELAAAARALRPDGQLFAAMHKDQGAKRYERLAAELFDTTEVMARERGWRLLRASGPRPAPEPEWLAFEAGPVELEALPGVYAAGKLDPGTRVLLGALEFGRFAGRRVLDLGCGYGLLGLLAARAGARVTLADDDLAAVRSAERNLALHGVPGEVRHSDVDSDLAGERFDAVLTNPPFHVGRGVRLELPRAFIHAARRLLRPGGELWLVANAQQPYEPLLADWAEAETAVTGGGFKVLRAVR